ncbi:MAG TPA: sigma-70 family RNA polymerase sigma factor [Acidimicrobiales bacterium]|nr:sigma-70 family RNA polymerase sigma factor [Acidimicrobiales bacterium]
MDSDTDGVSDEALLSGMAVGDDRSGLTFVRRYQRRLFGLAVGIVGDVGEAEDVTQEAFIRIFRHAQVFDARRGAVSTWALTITRNLAIDSIRVRRGVPTDPEDRVFVELMSPARLPDAAALASENVANVRTALAELPVDQRRAVLLAALYGRTAAQIAEGEGIPLGTAKSRIRLGMARLRTTVNIEEAL